MIDNMLFKSEEKAIFALRALYNSYGYLPFKMSKFEEYDIYVRNKDFLVSDSVITFNDTNGKLLALKPDVTLSIIKNTTDEEGCKQKVYYNENVYRVSQRTHQFKEIMQAGLECIGDIDSYDIFEAVYLAAKSLDTVSPDFVLDISHMGIVSAILDEASDSQDFKKNAVRLISERNLHE
ncbi:MAG: ATP phosphoribosyltransferase regulatory subunit, partial [Eggerthellaceae bacterium]|nr:ATP phosphoribosyltransferase regulatory subunit [Eggerthellaceae bacterium]